jgi:hypothetical protein
VSVARMTWWLVGLGWVGLVCSRGGKSGAVWCAVSRAEFGGKMRFWVPIMPASCRLFLMVSFSGVGGLGFCSLVAFWLVIESKLRGRILLYFRHYVCRVRNFSIALDY